MIRQKGWPWIAILGAYYLGLGLLAFQFSLAIGGVRAQLEGVELEAEFEGNDWVRWEDSDGGVIARSVHPLPRSRPIDRDQIRPGDRLLELDYWPITKAEAAENITTSVRPLVIAKLERTDPVSFTREEIETYIRSGFRLTFSFNDVIPYWHILGWLVGLGAFVALVMLAILLPLIRAQQGSSFLLLGVVLSALLLFLLQLFRHLYLYIESDLTSIAPEKLFIVGFSVLLMGYAQFYFAFRSQLGKFWYYLPGLLVSIWILMQVVDILYLSRDMKHFHDEVEAVLGAFFMLHLAVAVFLYLSDQSLARTPRIFWSIMAVGMLAVLGLVAFVLPAEWLPFHREHVFFLQLLLSYFPLVNATYLQLQFGKVSLVVTQTIQYLVAIVVSVVLYLLIVQLFDYLNTSIRYRRILEFLTFVIGAIGFRVLYQSNESRLRKYFVTSQQEKATIFRNFIAQIPQYTQAEQLRSEIVKQVKQYFQTEQVDFWWNTGQGEVRMQADDHRQLATVYHVLEERRSNWSRAKEIANVKLGPELEEYLLGRGFHLVFRVTVDEDNFALLTLGRKRMGVYNLSDIELMSQLVQQTQLTLNVLQLVTREKELIQQTYEANLTALRSQINPHFLFNTLNSIGELVHESADLAEAAVEKLAFIFRYTLQKSSQNFVPLSEEMRLIETYLDLEKIRFGDRLETHVSVAPGTREVQIPAFILQTLVENCIKHGIAKILHKGVVSIDIRREGDWLISDVFDNGPGIDLSRIYKSTGLSNSIARLENLYDQKNLLQFQNTGDGTLVTMRIPIRQDIYPAASGEE